MGLRRWLGLKGPKTGRLRTQVFICGCGHSGTTIFARIIGMNPKVYLPPFETETFIGNESVARMRYDGLMVGAARSGRRILVEKTPRHIRYTRMIRKIVPGAKFIVITRDGRDVAASYVKRTGSAEDGMNRWIEDTRLSLAERGKPGVLLLRYEDFVDDPDTVIRQACDFIGIRFEADMLNYHQEPYMWGGAGEIRKGNGRDGPEHNALRNWQVNQPIFDGRGIWKNALPDSIVKELTEGSGAPLMRELNYI